MSGPTNGDEVSDSPVVERDGAGLLKVYRPKRYAKLFMDEELQRIQADTLYLQYNGQRDLVADVTIARL